MPTEVTNFLTRIASDAAANSLTLRSADWTDGEVAHAGADYVIGLSGTIRTPNATPTIFKGNSLQLGTDSVRANLAQKNGELTFENDGLYLRNVSWTHWSATVTVRINGRVTVTSPRTKPALFTNSDGNDRTGCEFTGDWHAAPECGIRVSLGAPRLAYRLTLSGDLSDYRGGILVDTGAVLALGTTELPGEIQLRGGSYPGRLEPRRVGDRTAIGTLELESGSRLAFKVRRDPDGRLVHNSLFVTDRFAVGSAIEIEVNPAVDKLAGTEARRFPFLTLGADAAGELDADTFRCVDADARGELSGLRLEVGAGEKPGERTLYVVLPATAHPVGTIRYEDYGAVGDGIADDADAIVAAHAAANEFGLPVRARDDAVYRYVGWGKTAVIETDTDFGTAKFIIDDQALPDDGRGCNVFRIAPSKPAFAVGGVERIVKGERALGIALPGPCLLKAENATRRQFIRIGANEGIGEYQQEMFLADAGGTLDRTVPMVWDFDTVTGLTAYPVDERVVTVRGGRFETLANAAVPEYRYYRRGFGVERSNVRIEGLRHDVCGETDRGAPYVGFVNVTHCAHVTVTGCVFSAHRTYSTIGSAGVPVNMGSYDLSVGNAIDVAVLDCRQTTDISDSAYWGVFTSNYGKNLIFDGCTFSRFDAHQGVANATVRNSVIGYMGLKAIGFGTFLVENTEIRADFIFDLRSDYGSTWDGEFIIRNCRFLTVPKKYNRTVLVTGSNDGTHDFGYPCLMPFRITVDGLRIEDGDHYASYRGAYVFSDFNPANTSSAYVETYPYAVTEKVVLRDVTLASGCALRVSPNAWMFRNVEVGDALPADLACSLGAPVVGWNLKSLSVVADIAAFDAVAVKEGRLELTVKDVAGGTVATADRAIDGTGPVRFDVALPKAGSNYRCELAAYDGERKLAYVSGTGVLDVLAGSADGGKTWFSASAERGVSETVNGAWSPKPAINGSRFGYAIGGKARFSIADPSVGANRTTSVLVNYVVEDFADLACCPTSPATAALAACDEGTATGWRAMRRSPSGRREWIALNGHRPEAGRSYAIRMDTDFSVSPPRVRYAVAAEGETRFTTLSAADGTTWLMSAADGRTAVAFDVSGFGTVRSLLGTVEDAAIAETGGVRYSDFNEALAAGAAQGTDVTLLADVAFRPDRATGDVEIRLAGHRFKWRDGDAFALAFDATSGTFKGIRLDGGLPVNGLSSYDSYVLGLDAADPDSRPQSDLETDGKNVRLWLDLKPRTASGEQVTYRLESAATPDFKHSEISEARTTPEFSLPVDAGNRFFRFRISVVPPL